MNLYNIFARCLIFFMIPTKQTKSKNEKLNYEKEQNMNKQIFLGHIFLNPHIYFYFKCFISDSLSFLLILHFIVFNLVRNPTSNDQRFIFPIQFFLKKHTVDPTQVMQGHNQFHGLFHPDQEYVILCKKKPEMALDVSKDPKHQQKVILWSKHGKNNQRFKIQGGNGKFKIVSQDNHHVLTVPGSSSNNGEKIRGYPGSNAHGDFWDIVPAQGEQVNIFYIKSFCGKCLDANGGSTDKGTEIIQWDYNGGDNQKWLIKPIDTYGYFQHDKDYIITCAAKKNMALDVSQGKDKGEMLLWKKHGKQNQKWRIREFAGRFEIISQAGGVLEVPDASTNNGTRMKVGKGQQTQNQHWMIRPVHGQHDMYFIQTFNGKGLDVSEGKTESGTHILQWDFHGGENQMWRIEKA